MTRERVLILKGTISSLFTMNTPSPDRDSAVPSALTEAQISISTEAQIQGTYMLACQKLAQEIVRRWYKATSDPTMPNAISISSIDVSKDWFQWVKPLIHDQRIRLFACMWEFLAWWWDRSLLPQAQARYDQWYNPDATRTRNMNKKIQTILHEWGSFRQVVWLMTGATKKRLSIIINQGAIGMEIEKRIHAAHLLCRGYMIRLWMTYAAAMEKAIGPLAEMIQEFHDPIHNEGLDIAPFDKLAWDAILRLIGRVKIDAYLLFRSPELTTFQDIVNAYSDMRSMNPTSPKQ